MWRCSVLSAVAKPLLERILNCMVIFVNIESFCASVVSAQSAWCGWTLLAIQHNIDNRSMMMMAASAIRKRKCVLVCAWCIVYSRLRFLCRLTVVYVCVHMRCYSGENMNETALRCIEPCGKLTANMCSSSLRYYSHVWMGACMCMCVCVRLCAIHLKPRAEQWTPQHMGLVLHS